METKGLFQFEITINVSVSYFRLIWIPMLWVYDQYNKDGPRAEISKTSNSIFYIITHLKLCLAETSSW